MLTRILTPDDAELYLELRRQALLTEPLSFLSSPGDDVTSSVAEVRRQLSRAPEAVFFGAFSGDLAGSVHVYRDPKEKGAHKAHISRLFVRPEHRRRGAARALLAAALDYARRRPGVVQVHLGVSEVAAAARQLYESFGFRIWGTEPRFLHHAGRYVAKHHMVLALDSAAGAPE